MTLAHHYPSAPAFHADNFAKCPIHLIVEALDVISEEKLSMLAQQSTPIAMVGTAVLQSKGAKNVSPDMFNPFPKLIRKRELTKILSKDAAKTFLDLYKNEKLPPWAWVGEVISDCKTLTEE